MEEWKYIEKSNNELEVSNTGKIRNSKSKKELKLYFDKQKNELCVCYNKYHYVVKSEVVKCFIDKNYNRFNSKIIHKDNDLYNNNVYNLQIVKKRYGKEQQNKTYNKYIIEDDYIIVYINHNDKFMIDKEDIDLLQNNKWYRRKDNDYIMCSSYENTKKGIYLHKAILQRYANIRENDIIDHINRNKSDNRKCNLRVTNFTGNNRNQSISKCNTSGIIGVSKYYKTKNGVKWRAYITINNKHKEILSSYNFNECVVARLKAEKEYFSEFAPQRDLFEKYGI